MRVLILVVLLISIKSAAQVPVLLKSKNIDTFEVAIYEIKYSIVNDSVSIDDFKFINLDTYYVGDLSYYTVLPKNNWFLIIYMNPEGDTKSLFFQTTELSYEDPMVFTADFNTTKDYYVEYDPKLNTYVGSEITIPRN